MLECGAGGLRRAQLSDWAPGRQPWMCVWFLLRVLWAHVVWSTGKVCVVGVSGSAAPGLVELGGLVLLLSSIRFSL